MDEKNNPTAPEGNEGAPQGNGGYTPPATQADLDRIIENRLQRERAKYADYDQLKADSAKLGEAVAERDDYKSQLDAANAELATLNKEKQVHTWAQEVAQEKGVPAELLQGDTKEEMEAYADVLSKYVNVSAPVVRSDGRKPDNTASTSARDLFAEALDGII